MVAFVKDSVTVRMQSTNHITSGKEQMCSKVPFSVLWTDNSHLCAGELDWDERKKQQAGLLINELIKQF